MTEQDVIREQTDEGIVVLTFNRPQTMNALNDTIAAAIMAVARESKRDDSIRCIVLTGNGRGFCSGADVSSGGPVRSAGTGRGRSEVANKWGRAGDLITAMAEADVPIIGAINGAAAGAGFGLALACDVRIASDQARLGSIFIKRGIASDNAASFWLPRIVGAAKAFELMYTGDLLDAPQALAIGLVNKVVPHDSLIDETMAFARTIAAGAPLAYTYTRRQLMRALDHDLRTHLEYEWTLQAEVLASADAREGFRAFAERRQPEFEGKF
jgi:2-(1,2-epoxy-1,2-dihydrophenyl)acetyl-CoA isomerase